MKIFYQIFIISLFIIALPVQVLISLVILVLYGPPVIFRQKRIGLKGRSFVIYKFRSMRTGSENLQSHYAGLNEAQGPVFKIHNDPRLTGFGKFIRHTGLDELPQLFNVFKGDMALIGPRPLPILEAAKLSTWQKQRHNIKPGIISPWIINGYHSQSFTSWMKSDIDYLEHKSFSSDLLLFFKSVKLMSQLFIREILAQN